jgi:hypothetical protein
MHIKFRQARAAAAFALFITTLMPDLGSAWQPQYTQPAEQCVRRQEFGAGTNNVSYPFSRFYNTCNATIALMITTQGHGNNGPGAPMPGAFMVMGWTDGVPKATHVYACVYPGTPVVPGSNFDNPPSYDTTSYQCLVVSH